MVCTHPCVFLVVFRLIFLGSVLAFGRSYVEEGRNFIVFLAVFTVIPFFIFPQVFRFVQIRIL